MKPYTGKVWEPRVAQFDPPGLEETWIKYTKELLTQRKPTRSQLVCCIIGLRKYSKARAGRARHLLGQVNARLDHPSKEDR